MNRLTPGFADPRGTLMDSFQGLGYGLLNAGSSVPADATVGYETGALFFVQGGSGVSTLYRNEGTQASCAFKRLLSVTDTGSIDLTGLTATAAELNRAAKNSTRPVAAGAASLTVTQALHDGKTILLDQATGVAVTLPAMTGSGARYRFVCSVATSGGSHVITATGAHLFGSILMGTDTTATTLFTVNIAENVGGSTVITLNGSTQGGKKGDWFEIEDVATSIGIVRGFLTGTGTEATPFS